MPSLHQTEFYFFPHFVSRISPIVPPEIVSPSTGLPRKMILVSSLYPFGPNRFQALHGASIRHSLKVLAVQVKVCLGASSAKQGTVAPSNNTHATIECRAITASHKVQLTESNECRPRTRRHNAAAQAGKPYERPSASGLLSLKATAAAYDRAAIRRVHVS